MKFILRISKEIKWKVEVVLSEVSLMNFIVRISKKIKWKVKVVLLKVSLMQFILRISKGDQIEGDSGVDLSIIDELYSWDIQRDQVAGETGVTRRIMDELQSSDIQGDQMEGKSILALEVSSMNLILGMSKEIKWRWKRCYSKYH